MMHQTPQLPRQHVSWYCRHIWRGTLFSSSMLLAACGGGGDSATPNPPIPNTTIITAHKVLEQPLGREVSNCKLTLNKTKAGFLEQLTLTGLPENFAEPSFRIIAQDGQTQKISAGFFNQTQADQLPSFVAPIHPVTPLRGGKVVLEVGDGTLRCPTIELTVAAVPSTDPKLVTQINQKIATWLDLTIEQLGADPNALASATADTIAPELIPFALAKQSLAANGYLTRQAEQAVRENDQVLAGILKGSKLEAQLDAAIAALQALPKPDRKRESLKLATTPNAVSKSAFGIANPVDEPIDWLRPTTTDPIALSKHLADPLPKNAGRCAGQQLSPNPLSINSAQELAQRMLAAQKGYVFNDRTQTGTGQALGTLALSGSNGANYAGGGLYIIKTIENAKRALEPTELTSFTLGQLDTLLFEDRPRSQPARWSSATLRAQGQPFNISAAILDGFVTAVGMTSGPIGTAVTAGSTAFANQLGKGINELTNDSCFQIAAPKYGPFDVRDEQWTEFSIVAGNAVEKLSHHTYIGREIGASELQVKLRAEKFGSNRVFLERRNVIVQPQTVSLLPSQTHLSEPGRIVEISGTIADTFLGKSNLDVTITRGGGLSGAEIISRNIQGDFYTVKVQTPERRVFYPIHVTFTSLNPTLPASATRSSIATIDLKGAITLSQPSACLVPNSTLEITATLDGFANNQRGVKWDISGAGTLIGTQANSDGTQITATIRTNGTGALTIQASSTTESSVQATRTTTVSERCFIKTQIVGMGITAPTSSTDSDGGNGCANSQSVQISEQKYQTEEPTKWPALPRESERWFARSERISILNQAATISVQRGNANNTGCNRTNANSSVNADIRVYGENDGTLGFDFDADLQGSCSVIKNGDQDEVFCANSQAAVSSGGFHYLDIDRDTRVLVEGELKCSGLSGVVALTPMSLIAMRYESGSNGLVEYTPNNLANSLITDGAGNPVPPVLWADVKCTQANQTVRLKQEFIFKKPRQTGKTDRIIFTSGGNALAAITGTKRSGFGQFGLEPTDLLPPQSGDYRTTAKINFLIRITPK